MNNCMAQRITADKREIKDFPKLPSATSFIRKPLCESFQLKTLSSGKISSKPFTILPLKEDKNVTD